MCTYMMEVNSDIWKYLHNRYDNTPLSLLTLEYLLTDIDLRHTEITGISTGGYFNFSDDAEEHILNNMCELNDIVEQGYITDEEMGYKLRRGMYGDIDCIIRLRHATVILPIVIELYINDRKKEY